MQVYVGLPYQDLIKRQELPQPGRLPPVFPVVLYNGVKPWRANLSLAELIVAVPPDLQQLQAYQRYLLIDQSRLSDVALAAIDNFAAMAFRVERLQTGADVIEEIGRWSGLSEFESSPQILPLLSRWGARRLQRLARKRIIEFDRVVTEDQAMAVPVIKSFADAWRYEAELYMRRELLKKLLVKRFGTLSRKLNKRIEWAEMDDLDRWFDRIFDARSIQEIFAESQPA
ncbi:Rpn family recombination-promoting nuclease/putative transposase [Duganella caerulea]|uniref:Rpn family recombination-promoting nuclease/putative transposase n=1 Tax=Duganella caerulea TaxID=2885762 RepID=UPI004037FD4E